MNYPPPSEWEKAGLFDQWTFSVANDMINKGLVTVTIVKHRSTTPRLQYG